MVGQAIALAVAVATKYGIITAIMIELVNRIHKKKILLNVEYAIAATTVVVVILICWF